jgi:hypothetical protein
MSSFIVYEDYFIVCVWL